MENINLRNIVLNMLIRTLEKGELSHQVLASVCAGEFGIYKDIPGKKAEKENGKDRCSAAQAKAFANRLYMGTLEKLVYIDYVLEHFSNIPVRKMKPVIRNILRLSIYQIRFMDSVPDYTCIDEAVKLTKKRGFSNLSGYVNGVLRKVQREADSLMLPDNVKAGMPGWIYDLINGQYTREEASGYFEAVSKDSKETYIRLVPGDTDPEDIIGSLVSQGISVSPAGEGWQAELPVNTRQETAMKDQVMLPSPDILRMYAIKDFGNITFLDAFREGKFIIQDPSSVLAAYMAVDGIKESLPSYTVIDVCAAPGGKSLYVAEKLKGSHVIARDLTEHKIGLIKENARRLHMDNIEPQVYDARIPDPGLFGKADIVIADLPCSGLGVVRRKPDILYRLREPDLESLTKLQRQILEAAQLYVKLGGILLFSTCTVNKQENEENAAWFFEKYGWEQEYMKQFLPGRDPFDGFFIARFRKTVL